MTDEYPQYAPDGSEELFFPNKWRGEQAQTVEGADCFAPFVSLNPEDNLVVLKLTEQEYIEMFSALYAGAEFTYPERYLQIIANFLKGIHCPPEMEDQECYEYKTYASFVRYSPANPYISPDEIPEGYATQPFIVNGENGNDVPNYEHFDVLVPQAAITLDIDWWTTIAGQLPTIEVMVNGAGKAFLKMLTSPGGGLAVITLDNPPDLLDIIAGIVTAGENIIDLNQDLVSLPPETAQELIFEVDIDSPGLHTIYIVFLPILDDSFIPIRFGGGFRGVQLCDFVEQPEMGITALRVEDCNLEQQIDGEWSIVDGWEDFLASCIPSGGGGTGGTNMTVTTVNASETATKTGTNTAYDGAVNRDYIHNFTRSKALVQYTFIGQNDTAGEQASFRIGIPTAGGLVIAGRNQAQSTGTTGREFTCQASFTDIPSGNRQIWLEGMTTAGGTWRINTNFVTAILIIEYDNPDDLFVEDVQYVGGILQKKIGGVWINVVNIGALLSPIQTTANNAAAAAAAAQSTANNALTVANGAVTVNNTQNTLLTALESDLQQVIDVDIPQINLTLENHETRIEALEAGSGSSGDWAGETLGKVTDAFSALNPAGGVYAIQSGSYQTSPVSGLQADTGGDLHFTVDNAMKFGSVAFVEIVVFVLGSPPPDILTMRINNGVPVRMDAITIGINDYFRGYAIVEGNEIPGPTPIISDTMKIHVEEDGGLTDETKWRVISVKYLCIEVNPFTGTLFP